MAKASTYVGLFLIAMSTLMYEVLLTRIFSVTTWYHFAFLSISVTLFGLAAGGILIYLKPKVFTQEKTFHYMSVSSLAFALISAAAMLIHLYLPLLLVGANAGHGLIISVSLALALPFTIAAFTASGIAISLALTRFPKQVNYLYAADLLGAGLGCLAIVFSLNYVDAISDVFIVAALASLAALCFGLHDSQKKLATISAAALAIFAGLAAVQAWTYQAQQPLLTIQFTKGMKEPTPRYQLWNSFSRIRVLGDETVEGPPPPYALSAKAIPTAKSHFMNLDIDGGASTPIFRYRGEDSKDLYEFFPFEITNAVHHLRKNAEVAVIGAGGGKDVISALIMGQKHVTAIDINENVLRAVHDRFADFSGNLKQNPRVTLVNDEARSYITRSDKKFDIIQISMIDTWAATASGAYALSENGLYTTDAFKILLNHLTDNGILTISRWYAAGGVPSEMYRLTALAAESLKQAGIKNPEKHIMIFRVLPTTPRDIPDGVGTLLISKSPFTPEDYANAEKLVKDKEFDLVYGGTANMDPIVGRLATGEDPNVAGASIPYNLNAPTDDSPFFFQAVSLRHLNNREALSRNMNLANMTAGFMLFVAGIASLIITIYCIRIPYLSTGNKESVSRAAPLFAYFFCIGAGFMFVEISQIERLTIFLGHPVYGLSVVLFALLLSTGLGSLFSEYWLIKKNLDLRIALGALIAVLLFYALGSGFVLSALEIQPIWTRIFGAVAVLFPLGVVLGAAFPMGIHTTMRLNPALAPWLWGINGASSVCASVFAIIVAMFAGISFSYFCGVAFYVGALAAIHLCLKNLSTSEVKSDPSGYNGQPS